MPRIVTIETTVMLNILGIPGFDQNRVAALDRLEKLLEQRTNLLLSLSAVFETGNHITELANGQQRRKYADVLWDQVSKALAGQAPWTPLHLPRSRQLADWLESFPDSAMRGVGMVDQAIIKAWERVIKQNPACRVTIWSLDGHLTAYDHKP